MVKSILLPLDGSDSCRAARDWAIRFAAGRGARLTALGILDEPTITRPESAPIGGITAKVERDQSRLSDADERICDFLEDARAAFESAGVEHEVLEVTGVPHKQICLEAQRHDLIILASEPHFHFETQDEPGETLARTVEAAPRPIIIIPKSPVGGTGFLVSYDGRPPASRALQAATELGLANKPPVHVVTVDEDETLANQRCQLAIDYLTRHEIHATPRPTVSAENVSTVLLEQIAELRPEWVGLGAHGGRRIRDLFFGSVCNTLIEECPVPMFVHH